MNQSQQYISRKHIKHSHSKKLKAMSPILTSQSFNTQRIKHLFQPSKNLLSYSKKQSLIFDPQTPQPKGSQTHRVRELRARKRGFGSNLNKFLLPSKRGLNKQRQSFYELDIKKKAFGRVNMSCNKITPKSSVRRRCQQTAKKLRKRPQKRVGYKVSGVRDSKKVKKRDERISSTERIKRDENRRKKTEGKRSIRESLGLSEFNPFEKKLKLGINEDAVGLQELFLQEELPSERPSARQLAEDESQYIQKSQKLLNKYLEQETNPSRPFARSSVQGARVKSLLDKKKAERARFEFQKHKRLGDLMNLDQSINSQNLSKYFHKPPIKQRLNDREEGKTFLESKNSQKSLLENLRSSSRNRDFESLTPRTKGMRSVNRDIGVRLKSKRVSLNLGSSHK
jgi:hypothetical protein